MTSLATTEPALRRLFDRLDFAPQPRDETLSSLLQYWKEKRGDRLAPSPRDMRSADLKDSAAHAFMLQFDSHGKAPALMFGGVAFEALVGSCDPGAMVLTEAPERRSLVRLRRLYDLVQQRVEPVLAEFDTRAADGQRLRAEIFLTPLSSDGRLVDGLFGGVTLRQLPSGKFSRPSVPRRDPQRKTSLLFALNSAREIGTRIAQNLGTVLQDHEEREFEDGEHKARPLVDVRGKDVHVIASLHGYAGQSVNDRLCRLLFFIATLKDAGASHVGVVAPYLCYARKDRQTNPYDPVTTRYVGQLFEAVATDHVMTMEVHNLAAFQNAFRCTTTHLNAHAEFCRYISELVGETPIAVVSPDIGGAKRAESLRQDLERLVRRPVSKGLADKQRSMGQVSGDLVIGNVSGGIAVIVDDLISTGTTVARVAQQCREHGAKQIIVAATHGVGGARAVPNLNHPAIDQVVLTNTIPQNQEFIDALTRRVSILDVSGIFAQALADCSERGREAFSDFNERDERSRHEL